MPGCQSLRWAAKYDAEGTCSGVHEVRCGLAPAIDQLILAGIDIVGIYTFHVLVIGTVGDSVTTLLDCPVTSSAPIGFDTSTLGL